MIVQKINNRVESEFQMAFLYFNILSTLNDLGLQRRDCQLLAYAASEKKPISDIKKEFIEKFKSSKATVENIISKLYTLNVLIRTKHPKDGRRKLIEINPVLLVDFDGSILVAIKFELNGDKG